MSFLARRNSTKRLKEKDKKSSLNSGSPVLTPRSESDSPLSSPLILSEDYSQRTNQDSSPKSVSGEDLDNLPSSRLSVSGLLSIHENGSPKRSISAGSVRAVQSILSKKEKHINVEIGSLIGTPLCWTQPGSEPDQFRKSMLYVRFQEKKKKSVVEGLQFSSPTSPSSPSLGLSPPTPHRKATSDKLLIKLCLPLLESSLEKTVLGNGIFNVLI